MANDLNFITLDISLQAPVLMNGSIGDENMVTSEDYISGTAIRGTLVSIFLNGKSMNENDPGFSEFHDYFLSGKLQFLNAYPVNENNERLLPIPRSIQVGKRETDNPVDLLYKEKTGQEAKSQTDQTKYKEGYCSLTEYFFQKHTVAKQYQLHHERTNQRIGRSGDAELFNYESILPKQTFRSFILGDKSIIDKFLAKFAKDKYDVRLGRSRQTQYGRADLIIDKNPKNSFREISFSGPQKYQSIIAEEKKKRSSSEFETWHSLTFLSDVILVDKNGQNRVDKKILADTLGIADESLIEKSFLRSRTVEQYISAWKARTPSFVAFAKGSCFLIDNTVDIDELKKFEKNGLGLKKEEGFGRVAVNWQQGNLLKAEKIKKLAKKNQENREQKVPISVSEFAQPLVTALIKNRLAEKIQSQAAKDVKVIAADPDRFKKFCEKIRSTQLHKLRRFAQNKEVKTHSDYWKLIEQIPTSSQEKLKGASYSGGTFYEFLKNDPINQFMSSAYDDAELNVVGKLSVLQDSDFKATLLRNYYDAFFTLLAKRAKEASNG